MLLLEKTSSLPDPPKLAEHRSAMRSMSFAAGMAAGMGAGIAIGTSSGQKQVRDQLAQHFASQGITLLDHQGKQVLFDEALDEALRCDSSETRPALTILLVIGLFSAAAIAGAIYLFVANG